MAWTCALANLGQLILSGPCTGCYGIQGHLKACRAFGSAHDRPNAGGCTYLMRDVSGTSFSLSSLSWSSHYNPDVPHPPPLSSHPLALSPLPFGSSISKSHLAFIHSSLPGGTASPAHTPRHSVRFGTRKLAAVRRVACPARAHPMQSG